MTARNAVLILSSVLLALSLSCASRGTPGGGPIDRTPPEILQTEPHPDSTGITNLSEIVILFSERMDESTAVNAVFISPLLKYLPEWSGGDELTLTLQDTLKKDVTYVVTIGSGASDSRRNRMADSYQFAFSTGSIIQRGRISGLVYGISEKDPFYVYAYYEPDTVFTEVDPASHPADFLSQPGARGAFILNYLKPGTYRVFIVEDQNHNFLLDADYERVGIPTRDVRLDSANPIFNDLYFRVSRIDTIPPVLTGARAMDAGKVLLRMSEPVKHPDKNQITINDTLSGKPLNIRYVIPNKEEKNQYFIFTDDQNAGSGYRLMIGQLCDTSGNCQDSTQFAVFSGAAEHDTTRFRILKLTPRDSSVNVPIDRPATIQMSKAVDSLSFASAFTIRTSDDKQVDAVWIWDDLENGYLTAPNGFHPGVTYRFSIRCGDIISVWGDSLTDSTVSRTFTTRSQDDFGSFSGFTDLPDDLPGITHMFIKAVGGRMSAINFRPDQDGLFRIPWLAEGKYIVGGYVDLDRNLKYSPGSINPFKYAEPYYIKSDTINIRKRWEVSDYSFGIPALEIK